LGLATSCLRDAPAFAQMETIAAPESETGPLASEEQLTAWAIHEKLAAESKDKVDVLIFDVIKG
jgi:hypothetical protein